MNRYATFALGTLVGGTLALYGRMLYEDHQMYVEANRSMTRMFNSVPESQRFGYTEDFPENQKWSL